MFAPDNYPISLSNNFLSLLSWLYLFHRMWQIDILPISTTPFSLHLTSYNLKPSQPHANIIKPKLQQIFAKKKNAKPPRSGHNAVLVQSSSFPFLSFY